MALICLSMWDLLTMLLNHTPLLEKHEILLMAPSAMLLISFRVPYFLLELFMCSFSLQLLFPCCSCRVSFVPYFFDECLLCFFQHQSLYLLYLFVQLVHLMVFPLQYARFPFLSINFQLDLLDKMLLHFYPSLQGLHLFTQINKIHAICFFLLCCRFVFYSYLLLNFLTGKFEPFL